MNQDFTDKIIDNLRLLTMKDQIVWKNIRGGIFAAAYQDHIYAISLIGMTLDDIALCGVNEKLISFYDYVAEITVIEKALNGLNESCDKLF